MSLPGYIIYRIVVGFFHFEFFGLCVCCDITLLFLRTFVVTPQTGIQLIKIEGSGLIFVNFVLTIGSKICWYYSTHLVNINKSVYV